MRARDIDLALAVGVVLALLVVLAAFPGQQGLRIALGLPFLFFLPGYALVAALFPRRGQLSGMEQIALAVGLSIALVSLVGLALNYLPWGIRLESVTAALAGVVAVGAAVAASRRRAAPAGEAAEGRGDRQPLLWPRAGLADRAVALALVLALAALPTAAYFLAASSGSPERFTEFYVLGPEGRADAYPGPLPPGERAQVTLGVVNREGEDAAYRIVIRLDGRKQSEIDGLRLADGQGWEANVFLVPAQEEGLQRAEFLLYREGDGFPYRRLRLWLEVASPAAAGAETPPLASER